MIRLFSSCALIAATTPLLAAQSPELTLTPSGISLTAGPRSVSYAVVARSRVAYALLVDFEPGAFRLFGEEIRLGFSPFLAIAAAGTMPSAGSLHGSLQVPLTPANVGQAIYLQHISIDAQSPNGLFQASNGASLVAYSTPAALIETFERVQFDFEGRFANVRKRLEAAPVRRRVHSTVALAGVPFAPGVGTPLNGYGSRLQMVFRPQDLGSDGDTEVLTAIRWRPVFGLVQTESFDRVELSASHSQLVPDYSVGSFSALPNFPNSGLNALFASNYAQGSSPVSMWSGRYDIRPSMLTKSGYVPYPKPKVEFEYNGVESLLIEIATSPNSVPTASVNSQFGQLMVVSSPLPAARNHQSGNLQGSGNVVHPSQVTTGRGDNFMYDYELEFVRYKSTATRKVPLRVGSNPKLFDWQPPILAAHTPPGTKIELEFQGIDSLTGQKTIWSKSVDIADGLRLIRYRITFTANRTTGAVPSIDTLVIPVI